MMRTMVICRQGFTLIETLIALGLATMLLGTVWSMLSLSARVERQGAERALELQLVRSVCAQLQADLHAVCVPVEVEFTGTAAAPPAGIVGTSHSLQLFCRVREEFEVGTFAASSGPAERTQTQQATQPGSFADETRVAKSNWQPVDSGYEVVRYQYTPSPLVNDASSMANGLGPSDVFGNADSNPPDLLD